MTREHFCDVLVVGTGGAGCRAALTARAAGARVIQVAKGPISRSELTVMTMPGFGALIPENGRDSFDNYFTDTLDGGAYLNDRDLVRTLATGSTEAIDFLERLGVRFDRGADGGYVFYSGVEHTKTGTPRQLGVDDCMGRAFYNVLMGELARSGVRLLEDLFAQALLSDGERIRGLVGLDIRTGQSLIIWAGAVVLATGGMVGLYTVRTGHPRDTGDGQAMALRAGARLKDVEFIQSNPAAFYHPQSVRGVVVPGWYLVMDRGAKYFNGRGEEFLHLYDPERRETTTRDIKAKAMHQEILAGRASEHGGIYLDFTRADLETDLEEYLKDKAPFLLDYVRRIGLGPEVIFKKPMEVGPAAHYSCGGIEIDTACRTGLPGLLAAGEVTGGVHGANRLGNSAMTDIFVFGRLAGRQAAEEALSLGRQSPSPGLIAKAAELGKKVHGAATREPDRPLKPAALRMRIEELMFTRVGFGRDEAGLSSALEELARLKAEELPRVRPASRTRTYNYDLIEILELENLLDMGQAIALAALTRTEARGCHNRLDHPTQDDENWLNHVLIRLDGDRLTVDREPVRMGREEAE